MIIIIIIIIIKLKQGLEIVEGKTSINPSTTAPTNTEIVKYQFTLPVCLIISLFVLLDFPAYSTDLHSPHP
jgi:hypothetical protein